MKKDRKIQDFIVANKPQVCDNGQFMESLKRQMDLLPTPATMTEPENIDGQEWLAKLRAGMKASFRRDVLWVCGASLAMLCVAVVAYFLFFANTGITENHPLSAELADLAESAITKTPSDTEKPDIKFGSVTIIGGPANVINTTTNLSEVGSNLVNSFKGLSHLPLFYIILGLSLATVTILIFISVLTRDDVL